MALATLREVLEIARRTNTAIPGFNIDNIEISEAIMEAAEEENCPVILTIGQGAINAGGLRHLPDVVRRIGESSFVPVVMHLDHGISYEQTVVCLRAGFTSVMFDGSHRPFEENVRESAAVVRAAHAVGVSVECELGAISGVEDGISHAGTNLVDLDEVRRFIETVDCDALAIGIGNAHGIYKGTPNLDFDRLAACRDLGAPPLVLHGGSGIPKDMIQKAIRLGIRKINVATEVRLAFMSSLESTVGSRDIYAMYAAAKNAVRALAREKIRMFQNRE
ncbi:class II fructose-bisphosphate aldolase [Oscillibacter sp.]|uniref:class II fructose-bisphosphate aldolase n=1 Tax=Oscillibacter sp. TaxID=1945593 RepID=UPI002D80D727|nr:class II fructose-bisphosphate aldolase [Oscillibacter sp.]